MDHSKKRSWAKKIFSPLVSRSKAPAGSAGAPPVVAPFVHSVSPPVARPVAAATGPLRCGICCFELPENTTRLSFEYSYFLGDELKLDGPLDRPHKGRFSADYFRQSAARGCVMCTRFCDFFRQYLDILEDPSADGSQTFKGEMQWGIASGKDLSWTFPLSGSDEASPTKKTYNTKTHRMRLVRSTPKWSPYDNAGHPAICDGMRPDSTGSDESMDRLRAWLSTCVQNHKACAARDPDTQNPKRLLSIENGGPMEEMLGGYKVRMTEGAPAGVRYACLSHCWGGSQPLRLLKSNMAAFRNTIPWTAIPQTFQDACSVAVGLGIRYIWIDSLCIVQDDPADWEVEAACMISVYANSYITIAATAAGRCSEGLFATLGPEYLGVEVVPWRQPVSTSVLLRREPDHGTGSDFAPSLQLPLMDRGWVYQERLLSPRTVNFAGQELMWECRELGRCQCPESASADISKGRHHRRLTQHTTASEASDAWCEAVEDYSSLSLTFDSDRLVAVGGIARQFAAAHSGLLGDYLGGLWASFLPTSLCWSLAVLRNKITPRPEPPTAPTWSWASVQGRVRIPLSHERNVRPLVDIVSAAVTLAGSDPFGQVKSGQITLRGYALQVSIEAPDVMRVTDFPMFSINYQPDCLGDDHGADSGGISKGGVLFFKFYLSLTPFANTDSINGLLLQCVDESHQYYRRIGMVSVPMNSEAWREAFDVGNTVYSPMTISLV